MNMKILLLEDDKLFAQTIEDFLQENNFVVDIANDGEEVLNKSFDNSYDLYIFDINVPKIDGLRLLKELRDSGDKTATIFLTSYRDKERLHRGFENGADDYLKKPIDLDELLFRIDAIIKRVKKIDSKVVLKNGIIYDLIQKRVYKNGIEVNLAQKVIELLNLFFENNHSIVTKEMIIENLWKSGDNYSDGSIRVYVNRIKKLLGKESIKNIRGLGYKIEF